MPDRFASHASSLDSPAHNGFAVTPDDGAGLAETTRALYVGVGGDLTLVLAGGGQITFANVAAGTLLPLRASMVLATGTTAAAIVGLI